jgi:16S rRNA C967 or C1407 C5-methylase (RsmB/RsmF family)
MTCSLLAEENEEIVARFLAQAPGWRARDELRLSPDAHGDGFYYALLAAPDPEAEHTPQL